MSQDLAGRHALVCGASKGIGRAAARELGRQGARVTALARSPEALTELVEDLAAAGAPDPAWVFGDLDDLPRTLEELDLLLARRGEIHVLVNNTGGPAPGPLLEASAADLAAALARHVLAAHEITRRVLPGMRAAGFGRIVNVVSISVREPLPDLGVSNIARAAMAAWSKTLAMELPPGVTINCVLPGFTDTERLQSLAEGLASRRGTDAESVRQAWAATVPEGRIGLPEETAAAIGFLCSPAASYIRGVTLAVDGGRIRSL